MNRYERIIEWVFFHAVEKSEEGLYFERSDLERASEALGISCPKNLGDVIYSFRFRGSMPRSVAQQAPLGKEWVIKGAGKGRYYFALVERVRIIPNENMIVTKIPDATPEIISSAAQGDEQALLALVRYNRLIDIFLGITAYSLQNHLRTSVQDIGQVEIDEVYVGVDKYGRQYVVPVQAKGHRDEIGVTQPEQDIAVCQEKWPNLFPRSVAVQFMPNGEIAMMELAIQGASVKIVCEAHYRLVQSADISEEDRELYDMCAQSQSNAFRLQ